MALTEEQQAQRDALLAEIGELKGQISKLEGYRDSLQGKYDDVNDNVYTPESGYDLSMSTDKVHWAGKLHENGVVYQGETASGINTFMSGIMHVINLINEVIGKINEKIGELQGQVDAIGT